MLESITLQGFKSFAEKTRLEFNGGVCAVIGPNGSGKSNVVEALRWVTQQARSRDLRAGKATELIFHGSGGKAPLGLAEVQLELRLPEGHLSLSRRIYRDGSSEQDLGGKPVRVRDIHAALRGTGLGPNGLAVIGQGEVSGVVQAEGKTLLGYLQEAAGLSRAVSARQDTQTRLEGAERHLGELRLVEQQWQQQVEQLAKEAQQARLERQYRLRSLALQEALERERQQALEAEIVRLRQQEVSLEAQVMALGEQIQGTQTQREAAREAALLAQAEQAAYQQAAELSRAAQEAAEQQRHYLSHLTREAAELKRDLSALPQQAPPTPTSSAPLLAQLQLKREQLAHLEQAQRRLTAQIEQVRLLQAGAQTNAARLSAQHETLQREINQLQAEQLGYATQVEAAREVYTRAQVQRQQAAAQAQAYAEQQRQVQQLEQQLSQTQLLKGPVERELQRLGQSLDSYARYGEGPRRALSSDHAGIVGSVADLLSVSAEYEVALQAALGRRLEQVVVSSAEDAREIIELLKRQGGRATFLPLDLLRVRARRDGPFLAARGVLGNLADLCPSDPPQVAEALLADTLLLSDLATATALARQYSSRPRLVTLEGEVLEPGGALTGGRIRDTGFSVLADQRRYHELQAELEALIAREQQLLAQVQAAAPQPLSSDLSHWQMAERQAEKALTQLEATASAAAARLKDLSAQQLALPEVPLVEKLGEGQDLKPLITKLSELEQQLVQARTDERSLSEAVNEARNQEREWHSFQASAEQRAQLNSRLERNRSALAAQQEQLGHTEQEAQRREQEMQALRPAAAQAAQQQHEELSQRYGNLLAQQNRLVAQLSELRLTVARREGSRQPIPDGALLGGTPREWQAELTKLRGLLADIGVVNALAEAEHAQQLERLQELQSQRLDAETASQELRAHLDELAQQEGQATKAAYERVNTAFAEYSQQLLGGSGEVEADYDDAGRLVGLRLSVQPRGKRTRNLNLLSAGERTMAGLGFLFALNHAGEVQGLPLAVLDEVDAPLDEANIRRFTHFLQVFAAKGAQFVLVTHQKATMEVAKTIWGVTTDSSGASKLLSIASRE